MLNAKAFLGVNLDLLENPKYKNLDTRAMMLYALYSDRYSASMNNARLGNTAFVDDMGVFIRFTNELAAKVLHVSRQKITDFRKDLADLGLIKVVREGLKGYKIYVYPVQQTPENVELLLPWKNHTITVQKTVSDWTITSKIQFCENLQINYQNVDMTVSRISERTCSRKSDTSLSHYSLSQEYIYNNGLVDNAPAREDELQAKPNKNNTNPYNSLPEKIKSSFANTFGFITEPMAIELHSLINQSNEDMVNYVITSSNGRKITNAIAYIKAAITNALKRGAKTVQDMVDYYEQNVKPHSFKSRPKFMGKKQVEKLAKEAEEAFAKANPDKWNQIMSKRNEPKPLIPVFKLSDEPRIPIFNLS